MSRVDRFKEQYASMTPIERNCELRSLFGLVPDLANPELARLKSIRAEQLLNGDFSDVLDEGYKALEETGRRDRSDYKLIGSHRLNTLLKFGIVTETGRRYILHYWDQLHLTVSGDVVRKYAEPLNFYGQMFGWEPKGREGLFNKAEAPEVEKPLLEEREKWVEWYAEYLRTLVLDPELVELGRRMTEAENRAEAFLSPEVKERRQQGRRAFLSTSQYNWMDEGPEVIKWRAQFQELHSS